MDIEERIRCVGMARDEGKAYCLMETPCFLKDRKHIKPIRLYDPILGDGEYHSLPKCGLYDLIRKEEAR